MFKRLAVVVLVLMLAASAYAVTDSYTYVSGNSVTFTTTAISPYTVVTFNSIIKRMMVRNRSTTDNVYMDVKGQDINGTNGGCSSATVFLPIADKTTSSTVVIDFATRNIGFKPDSGGNGADDFIEYTVFSDTKIE